VLGNDEAGFPLIHSREKVGPHLGRELGEVSVGRRQSQLCANPIDPSGSSLGGEVSSGSSKCPRTPLAPVQDTLQGVDPVLARPCLLKGEEEDQESSSFPDTGFGCFGAEPMRIWWFGPSGGRGRSILRGREGRAEKVKDWSKIGVARLVARPGATVQDGLHLC
jgi:hypothetical protein